MRVKCPRKPSARRVSAAQSPASEAPTITMRPLSLKAAPVPLLCMWLLGVLVVRCLCPFDEDSLHGTRRRRAQHLLPLRLFRGWVVKERFLSMQPEDAGCQETTLRVGLAAIQINHDAHLYTSGLLRGCTEGAASLELSFRAGAPTDGAPFGVGQHILGRYR